MKVDLLEWEVEREQKSKNQQVLTRFFGRRELPVETKDTELC